MPRIRKPLEPFWQTTDGSTVQLYQGDVIDVLRRLPAGSVQCVVTSPPYWGLRDYGTAAWEGGDEGCDHRLKHGKRQGNPEFNKNRPSRELTAMGGDYPKLICPRCGAHRIDQQIGSERTPDEYVAKLVAVFREVRRVLRDDGTVWLNMGDCFGPKLGMKKKGVAGIPHKLVFALEDNGWIHAMEHIWHKPNPMPESAGNRCTKAHEYLFLLTKKLRYFYDTEAIREPLTKCNAQRTTNHYCTTGRGPKDGGNTGLDGLAARMRSGLHTGRNKRSVWTIATQGYPGAHFATFPPKLVEPCIKAGTSERGCCEECGSPWVRVVETTALKRSRPNDYVKRKGEAGTGNSCANSVAGVDVKTLGWEPTCKCNAGVVPCTVMDIFVGSGTTCCVALDKGRRSIGIDLSEAYLRDNAVVRIEGELLARPALARLAGKATKKLRIGRELT